MESIQDVVEEVVKTGNTTGVWPDIAKFRVVHERDRGLIDDAVAARVIIDAGGIYLVPLDSLAKSTTPAGKDLFSCAAAVLRGLKDAYRRNTKADQSAAPFLKEYGLTRPAHKACLYLLLESMKVAGSWGRRDGEVITFRLGEGVLDSELPDGRQKQRKEPVVESEKPKFRTPKPAQKSYKDDYSLAAVPIAHGAQADVFLATHRRTGRKYALKRRKGFGDDDVARMRREIEVLVGLNHRHVIPLLDCDVVSHEWYVMPVATPLSKEPLPIDDRSVYEVVRHVLRGLEAAHEIGVVHRDLKPSNILRLAENDGGVWCVADWGCVRRAAGDTTVLRTKPGSFFGTFGYSPPEAHDDAHSLDYRGDLYMLGRVVAWATTGREPVMERPLLPEGVWREFVERLTARAPEERPQSFAEVRDVLDGVAAVLAPDVQAQALGSASEQVDQREEPYLDDAEVLILAVVAAHCPNPLDCTHFGAISNDLGTRVSRFDASAANRTLLRSGLLETFYNEPDELHMVRLSPAGEDWVLENRHRIRRVMEEGV